MEHSFVLTQSKSTLNLILNEKHPGLFEILEKDILAEKDL
jgi:hypothetical protein